MERPETIENRWDILYRDYPEVYEACTQVKETPVKDLGKMLHVKGKVVVDMASGTGRSTFQLARYAKKVIGIEPEEAMMRLAKTSLAEKGLTNVEFQKGTSDYIPLADRSVDIVVAFTSASFYDEGHIQRFVREAERVLVAGGCVYSIDVAPRWYGGDMARVILGPSRSHNAGGRHVRDETFTALGFKHNDFYVYKIYDSLDHIVSTYGFIHGKKAIEYLKEHNKTTIKCKFRIYSKKVA